MPKKDDVTIKPNKLTMEPFKKIKSMAPKTKEK
jgi:hypothetical protein